ncbi:MAG: FAD-dependent oxidoreductase [Rubrivivax sp.]|nr:FAD-dependent oxidoreductase [Rubrivivax sp.]
MTAPRRIAVVGGGWAGLAAAVRAVQAGHHVTLLEMAQQLGGRARSLPLAGNGAGGAAGGDALDNGQHILIGAYRQTLDLLRTVGGHEEELLRRRPLELRYADGRGLALPAGPAWIAFVRGVAGCTGWTWRDRAALVRAAAGWALDGFRCDPALTVHALCERLPPAVRELLIDPLCVAALNTPAREASAQVLLRVLRDALFGGRGAADLLLPRRPLSELLPEPAARWLSARGARVYLGQRVVELTPDSTAWRIGSERFDAIVIAAAAAEAARLALPIAPAWAAQAQALRYEPIVTVYIECRGARLPAPMTALVEGAAAPAQFAFDHGALGGTAGRFAFVVSGARPWVERGSGALAAAVLDQARSAMPQGTWPAAPRVLKVITERRATFRCTPGLPRPPMAIAPRLLAAGDYVAGPYPATLEGAVRSGEQAAAALFT